jgi:hypothetical protein
MYRRASETAPEPVRARPGGLGRLVSRAREVILGCGDAVILADPLLHDHPPTKVRELFSGMRFGMGDAFRYRKGPKGG